MEADSNGNVYSAIYGMVKQHPEWADAEDDL
jgi:hypothetical protein